MFRLNYDNIAERTKEIDKVMNKYNKDRIVFNRLSAIKMYLQGEQHLQISKATGIGQITLKHLKNLYNQGGIESLIKYHSIQQLSEEQKEQISRLFAAGMTKSEIAFQVGCSLATVRRYKNYNLNKIEKQNEVENNMTIEEIEKKITEQENVLQELKKELEKVKGNENKIPDDVKDIPQTFPNDMYVHDDRYNDIIGYLICGDKITHLHKNGIEAQTDEIYIKHRFLPTEEMAKEFYDKTQLIADCLYFKWLYDREYVPDWSNSNENKHFVSLDFSKDIPEYVNEYYYCYDYNCVCFSTEQIAEKCAEWLNYKYKKGKYAE